MTLKLIRIFVLFVGLLSINSCTKKDKTLFEGGFAISNCHFQHSPNCLIHPDQIVSPWAHFATLESCQTRVRILKEDGLRSEPFCIPCKRIYYSEFSGFNCDWP